MLTDCDSNFLSCIDLEVAHNQKASRDIKEPKEEEKIKI